MHVETSELSEVIETELAAREPEARGPVLEIDMSSLPDFNMELYDRASDVLQQVGALRRSIGVYGPVPMADFVRFTEELLEAGASDARALTEVMKKMGFELHAPPYSEEECQQEVEGSAQGSDFQPCADGQSLDSQL